MNGSDDTFGKRPLALYLLSNTARPKGTPAADTSVVLYSSVAPTAHCDRVLWHRRCGHLNMLSLLAHHDHGVPSIPALPGYVRTRGSSVRPPSRVRCHVLRP
jgi:hypothetical protein